MHYNFRRLSDKALMLGVPNAVLVSEGLGGSLLFFFLFRWWYIVLSLILITHIVSMVLSLKGGNIKKEFSFLLNVPYRRVYKEKTVYLPIVEKD